MALIGRESAAFVVVGGAEKCCSLPEYQLRERGGGKGESDYGQGAFFRAGGREGEVAESRVFGVFGVGGHFGGGGGDVLGVGVGIEGLMRWEGVSTNCYGKSGYI